MALCRHLVRSLVWEVLGLSGLRAMGLAELFLFGYPTLCSK